MNRFSVRGVFRVMDSVYQVKPRFRFSLPGAVLRAGFQLFFFLTAIFFIFDRRAFVREMTLPELPSSSRTFALEDPECDLEQCFGYTPDELGCQYFEEPEGDLRGLAPDFPILGCALKNEIGNWLEEGEYVFKLGCRAPHFFVYILFDGDEPTILKNHSEMQAFYGPIETEAEAYSYAAAVTNLESRSGFSHGEGVYIYRVLKVETTHVESVPGGYLVNLFRESFCSCSPFAFFQVDLLVTSDGVVTTVDQQIIYQRWLGAFCID